MGPILFAHNENIAHIMPHVTARAVTSCMHRAARTHRQASALIIHGTPGDVPFTQAKLYLTKITASHFNTLNMKIANQNVLERILTAMLNENTAVSNENFRICSEESIAPLYKW